MRFLPSIFVLAVAALLAFPAAQANGIGHGRCKAGFNLDTRVSTESRGELRIVQVQVNDRVWSFNQDVGKTGWSRVSQRIEQGPHLTLLADFVDPDTQAVTPACWRIKQTG